MSKVKTYWDEIKKQSRCYYGGKQGWEVRYKSDETYSWDKKTGEQIKKTTMTFIWPFSYGDGVPASEKVLCKADVKFQHFKLKTLAQASQNEEEYRDLVERVSELSEDEFKKLTNDMKGFNLSNYICQTYLTHAQAHTLFWRM